MRTALSFALLLAACSPSHSTPSPRGPQRVAGGYAEAPEPELDGDVADLVMGLYAGDLATRESSANQLAAMGAAAAPALPELIACAGTEPFEGGSRDGALDPGYLAEAEPVEACAAAIADITADAPRALVDAMTVPLDTKRAALASLGQAGAAAVPGLAAVYLDACERSAIARDDGAVQHLRITAGAALAALAANPALAAEALGADSDCARAGLERL